jgi:glutathione S-transferase
MLIVHHLNNSRSQRVLWLLEELGVPYEIVQHTRYGRNDLAPPEVAKIHPLGKLPILIDGDITLAESGAIMTYLVERYGEGRLLPPPGTPEHLRYLYWMHYAEGSGMQPLLLKVIFDRIEAAPLPFYLKPVARALSRGVKASFVTPQLKLHLDFMETELAKSTWFAGDDMTVADLQMSFVLQAAEAYGGLDGTRPHLVAFLRRIEQRPAWLRAIERGGPYHL